MSAQNLRAKSTKMGVVLLSSSLFLAAACGGDEPQNEEDMGKTDVKRPPKNNTIDGWETGVVDSGNVGLHPKLARSAGGAIGVAYYSMGLREDGECTELMGEMGNPVRARWMLKFADFDGSAWTVETIDEPLYVGTPPGLDLDYNGETPLVSSMTGVPLPMFLYCGVNDAGLYTRGGPGNWSSESVVAGSAEVVVGNPASDFGQVVGYYPALAVSPSGEMAYAYKDVHGGGLQSDDFRKADLEMAIGGPGGWNVVAVDFARGAGEYTEVEYDSANRPIVVQINRTESPGLQPGVFAHRSSDSGATWEEVQLFNNPTSDGPSIARGPDGTMYVAYYQSQRGFPEVLTLVDESQFTSPANGWTYEEIGDSRFDEGYGTSIAVSNSGTVGVAYRRCNVATAGLGNCNFDQDALVFSHKTETGWESEVVDPGGLGTCGEQPSLIFDSLNRPVIVYRCELETDTGFDTQLHWARRSTPL